MQDTALFTQLLGLCSPWKVTEVIPDLDDKSITVRIEWPKGEKGSCPECNVPCQVHDHREERTWRHLDTMQFKTLLICPVPRVNCKVHGIKSLQVPWADMKGRFTMLFERFAIDVLQSANNKKKAAELLGLSWDEVHHIQERAVERGLARRKLDQPSHFGIDEKSFLKGHSYASILYDLDESRVLDVVQDRTEDSAKVLFQTISEKKRAEITAVAVDMWPAFISAIQSILPNSVIVHDKYHVVSHLTKAVDNVRRKENTALQREGKDLLKGTRYTWLRNPVNWTADDRRTFKSLQIDHLKVGRAWSMKEAFLVIWDYTYEKAARTFFKKWYFWATHSRLLPVIKVANTSKNHLDNILTYLHHPITNAKAEGFNFKIQSIKAAAREFRNFNNYRTSILFYCGRLAMYP